MAYYIDTPKPYRQQYIESLPSREYRDIDMNFARHPATKDILVKENESAIKQAIVNLVMLNYYEKPFHPEIGSNIYKALFENFGSTMKLKRAIRTVLETYEPRIDVGKIETYGEKDKNELGVNIQFKIISSLKITSVDILLDISR